MARYLRPATLDEALSFLAEGDAGIVAGGTDFFPMLGDRPLRRDIIDITGLEELRGISFDGGMYRFGALATWTEVVGADLPPWFEGLKLAAREVGSIQIQNAGTVAGNVCNASPAADGVAALMALDARVEILSRDSRREMALADFILGPRKTALRDGEVVGAILVPDVPGRGAADFQKLGSRHYLVISIAMVAATLHADDDGRIMSARVSVGSCAPVARRLSTLERRLARQRIGDGLADAVEREDLAVLSPISDVRASADYRRDAALTLVRRAVARCEECLR